MDINYNTLPDIYKKGTVLLRDQKAKKEGGLTQEEIESVIQDRLDKEPHKYSSEEKV